MDLELFSGDECPIENDTTLERYARTLDVLASRISFQNFQMAHQKYSQFFGRMSHSYHCHNPICRKRKHKEFERFTGLCLQPIIHYLVLDWVELLHRLTAKKKESESDRLKLFFQLLDYSGNNKIGEAGEAKVSSNEGRKNVWLTLINFPEPSEIKNDSELELLGLLFNFLHQLNIRNANLVTRGSHLDTEHYSRY